MASESAARQPRLNDKIEIALCVYRSAPSGTRPGHVTFADSQGWPDDRRILFLFESLISTAQNPNIYLEEHQSAKGLRKTIVASRAAPTPTIASGTPVAASMRSRHRRAASGKSASARTSEISSLHPGSSS